MQDHFKGFRAHSVISTWTILFPPLFKTTKYSCAHISVPLLNQATFCPMKASTDTPELTSKDLHLPRLGPGLVQDPCQHSRASLPGAALNQAGSGPSSSPQILLRLFWVLKSAASERPDWECFLEGLTKGRILLVSTQTRLGPALHQSHDKYF